MRPEQQAAIEEKVREIRSQIDDVIVTPLERECTIALLRHLAFYVQDHSPITLASSLAGANVVPEKLSDERATVLLKSLEEEAERTDFAVEPGRLTHDECREVVSQLVRSQVIGPSDGPCSRLAILLVRELENSM